VDECKPLARGYTVSLELPNGDTMLSVKLASTASEYTFEECLVAEMKYKMRVTAWWGSAG
jgi:hypothetical protein